MRRKTGEPPPCTLAPAGPPAQYRPSPGGRTRDAGANRRRASAARVLPPRRYAPRSLGRPKGGIDVNRLTTILATVVLLLPGFALAQDVMKYGVKHLKVLAEDDKVRVLHFSPHKGDKTPMHSHLTTVIYVVKGGRIRYTFPDGTTKDAEIKTGDAFIRPPVTHADEALDDLESILIELKK
jgi:quercetin dioxygenase-like cupin family protein